MTPTDRLSGFGTGLATNSDSGERVPRGRYSQYSNPNGSAHAFFFVAWLPRIFGPRGMANNALWACSCNPSVAGRCVTGRIGFANSADLNSAYSAHRPIEA